MQIAIGSDHAGRRLKDRLTAWLLAHDHDVEDVGTHDDASCDYPDFAHAVADRVLDGRADRGVLICGTGQGMAMTVNKRDGLRAAVVADPFSAEMAALHNDAKVLCMGERVVGSGVAEACLSAWISAAFEGGRHQRRIDKMTAGAEAHADG